MKISVNDNKVVAIYDSGANVSIINYDTLQRLKLRRKISGIDKLNTFAGPTKTIGSIVLETKIFDVTKPICFYIVSSDTFKGDVLSGLDMIKKFKLCQNENLEIFQAMKEAKRSITEVKASIDALNYESNKENTIEEIVNKHADAFTEDKFEVGKAKDCEASIELTQRK